MAMTGDRNTDSGVESLRIVCVSDTHGGNQRLDLPAGDVAIFAGDLTRRGRLEELERFDARLGELPHATKIVVAGNHDVCFEQNPDRSRQVLSNATYLEDRAIEIGGRTFYGSPWQPRLVPAETSPWAFDRPRGEALAEKWKQIPDETDVLVTHSPPKGVRDEIYTGERAGCGELANRVAEIAPDLHVFGHVHEHPGIERGASTLYANACSPGGYGRPVVLEYRRGGTIEIEQTGEWLPDWIRERMDRRAAEYG